MTKNYFLTLTVVMASCNFQTLGVCASECMKPFWAVLGHERCADAMFGALELPGTGQQGNHIKVPQPPCTEALFHFTEDSHTSYSFWVTSCVAWGIKSPNEPSEIVKAVSCNWDPPISLLKWLPITLIIQPNIFPNLQYSCAFKGQLVANNNYIINSISKTIESL